MKKVLLAAFAALAITSCSQNEEFDNQNQSVNNEIKVGTVVKKTTRAADLTNSDFKSFKLSSFIIETDHDFATDALGNPYMNGILYTGGQGSWETTGGSYYWPTGKNVQFFGWSSGVEGSAEPALTVPVDKGYPSLEFTIGANAAVQKDIVAVAQKATKPAEGNADVTLAFKHILTKISFSVKTDAGYTYAVSALSIEGVKGGVATYTFNADNGEWNAKETTAQSYAYEAMTIGSVADSGYYTLTSSDGALMLLPQSIGTKQATIKISYSVEKSDVNYTYSAEKVVEIPATTWTVGQNIRYKLTLPAGEGNIGINTTNLPNWDAEAPSEI